MHYESCTLHRRRLSKIAMGACSHPRPPSFLLLPSLPIPLSPFPPLSSPFLSLPLSPSLPLEVGPLNTARESGEALSASPSGVLGGAPAKIEFGAF